ncbi:MAG: 7-cyano-7-deazaguanine synthase QueC [Succinivibrionaceae bacterium]
MTKVVVLLSGGVDSTTCLALAVNKYGADNVFALNITYGQKHVKEIACAQKIANYYRVNYKLMDLSSIFAFSDCSLLQHSSKEIEHKSYAEQLKDLGGEGTVSTYVPFRNGLMLSTASAIAQSLKASEIWYGAHKDDAAGRAYPDCTKEFVDSMSKAIYEGTGKEITLCAPFIDYNKAEIVKTGLALKVPYELTWSCYEGNDEPCFKCGTCIDRHNAFEANSEIDPLEKLYK